VDDVPWPESPTPLCRNHALEPPVTSLPTVTALNVYFPPDNLNLSYLPHLTSRQVLCRIWPGLIKVMLVLASRIRYHLVKIRQRVPTFNT
jgi:hypothetical protein